MIIENIGSYRDGGTTSIKTNLGHYTIDRRIMTDDNDNIVENPTKNRLFEGYPDKGMLLDLEQVKQLKKSLTTAIKKYTGLNKEYGLLAIKNIKI